MLWPYCYHYTGHLNYEIISWKQPKIISHCRLMWVWNKNLPLKKPLQLEYSDSIMPVLAGRSLTFRKKALLNIMCCFLDHHFEGWFTSCIKQNIFEKINCSFFTTKAVNTILSQGDYCPSLVKCIVSRSPRGEEGLRMGIELEACEGVVVQRILFPPACIVLGRYFLINVRHYFSNLPLDFNDIYSKHDI